MACVVPRALLAAALALGLAAPLAGVGTAAAAGPRLPEATEEGRFPGTWQYNSASLRFALFIRESEDGFELKVQWDHARGGERFETDWQGEARYIVQGYPAQFSLRLDAERSTPHRLVGTYLRRYEREGGDYREATGEFTLERAHHGHLVIWKVPEITTELSRDGTVTRQEEELSYLLHRGSFRVVPWDELIW